jgi:hypothetical protein
MLAGQGLFSVVVQAAVVVVVLVLLVVRRPLPALAVTVAQGRSVLSPAHRLLMLAAVAVAVTLVLLAAPRLTVVAAGGGLRLTPGLLARLE